VETAKPEESFIRDLLIEQQSHHLAAQFQSLFHPPLLLLSRPSQICVWRGAARRRSGHCRWSATYRPTRSAVSIANTATTLSVCFRGSIADCASASCPSTAPIAQLKVVATRSSRVTPGSTRVLARHDRVRGPGGRRKPAGGLQELLKARDLFPFGNDQQRKDAPVLRQNSIRPVFSITSSGRPPLVAMLQSSDFGDLNHRSALRWLLRSRLRRILT
jgi:hypothetical protein